MDGSCEEGLGEKTGKCRAVEGEGVVRQMTVGCGLFYFFIRRWNRCGVLLFGSRRAGFCFFFFFFFPLGGWGWGGGGGGEGGRGGGGGGGGGGGRREEEEGERSRVERGEG